MKRLSITALAAVAFLTACSEGALLAPTGALRPQFDDIPNNLDASIDAVAEAMPLNAGGANGTTQLYVSPTNGDGKNGCNLTGSTTLVVSVASSEVAVATVSPSSVTFASCGDTHTLTIAPVGVGSATISLLQTSNNTGATFNLAPATFTVNVAPAASTNQAPVLTGIGAQTVDEGSELAFTAQASDPDAGQTLTFSLADEPSGASISLTTGAFSWTPVDGTGSSTKFKVVVSDNGSPVMVDDEEITVTVNNVAPTATFNAPASVVEGSNILLSLTSPVDPSSVDVTAGFSYEFDCGSGLVVDTDNAASCSTSDVGTRSVGGKIGDKDGGNTTYSASVTITDWVPSITSITPSAPLAGIVSGSATVGINVAFTGYPGDTFTGGVDCGGGGASNVSGKTASLSSFAHNCTYTEAGVYTITATIADDDGSGADHTKIHQFVVVYDPTAGFVTGGGWIQSQQSFCIDDNALCSGAAGKGHFGFVSKYLKGTTVPTGNTEFRLETGSFKFTSSQYEWLVVNQGGQNAQFKGTGQINGAGAFKFQIWATDASTDKFRIRIWTENGGGETTVYDTGSEMLLNNITGNGSIQIHQPKK